MDGVEPWLRHTLSRIYGPIVAVIKIENGEPRTDFRENMGMCSINGVSSPHFQRGLSIAINLRSTV